MNAPVPGPIVNDVTRLNPVPVFAIARPTTIEEALEIAPADARFDANGAVDGRERKDAVHRPHVEVQAPGACRLAAHAEMAAADGEREIGFAREVVDGLRTAIFGESEVVFGEIVDDLAVLAADCGEDVDDLHFDRDGGSSIGGRARVGWTSRLLQSRGVLGNRERDEGEDEGAKVKAFVHELGRHPHRILRGYSVTAQKL